MIHLVDAYYVMFASTGKTSSIIDPAIPAQTESKLEKGSLLKGTTIIRVDVDEARDS